MLFSSGVFCVPLLSVCALEPRKSSPGRAISRLSLTSHLPRQFFHPESRTLTSLLWAFSLLQPPLGFLPLPAVCLYDLCLRSAVFLSFPPSLLSLHHLRSISVFSPPSMWLQPFSHPTSNQTYSAYWWPSEGPQVDFYQSLHEAPPLLLQLPTSQTPSPTMHQPTSLFFLNIFYLLGCFLRKASIRVLKI